MNDERRSQKSFRCEKAFNTIGILMDLLKTVCPYISSRKWNPWPQSLIHRSGRGKKTAAADDKLKSIACCFFPHSIRIKWKHRAKNLCCPPIIQLFCVASSTYLMSQISNKIVPNPPPPPPNIPVMLESIVNFINFCYFFLFFHHENIFSVDAWKWKFMLDVPALCFMFVLFVFVAE